MIITWSRVKKILVVNEKGETLVLQQVSQQVEVSQVEMEEVKPLKKEVVDDQDWILNPFTNFRLEKSKAAVPLHKTLIYEIEPDCKYHTFATRNTENL